MTVSYSRRALAQLDEILSHIRAENPRAAAAVAERIDTVVSLIARHPMMGRSTDLKNVRVFRATPYPYLIFYKFDLDDGGMVILRIRHTARKEFWRKGR